MNKKTLNDLVENMVDAITEANNLEPGEARALVVIALKSKRDAILGDIQAQLANYSS